MTATPPPVPPLPTPPGWEGILSAGEHILWQGRPSPRLRFVPRQIPRLLFALAFTGFSVFWMSKAMQSGGGFWMFGLIFFGLGLYQIAQVIAGNGLLHRFTHYTLTNRRAIIATNPPLMRKTLQSYPISADTPLDFRNDDPPSIHFTIARMTGRYGTEPRSAGFENITDGQHVLALMRKIQRGEA